MSDKFSDDIKKARELLSRYEKNKADHLKRTMDFKEAFYILNECLKTNPDFKSKELITNIKLSYAKQLLSELVDLPIQEPDIWFLYLVILFLTAKSEVQILIAKYPMYKENYENFISHWKNEVLNWLN